jgi:elongator complex protein 2
MRLLTASMDRTMIVWEPVGVSEGIWLDTVRVGEMGGNTLGFYGCAFAPRGDSILAHGYNGAFHLWKKVEEKEDGGETNTAWEPIVTVSGHFAGVEDLMWDTTGNYFMTVSEDKTARTFAPWALRDKSRTRETWHEIARPQIHGYELTTLTFAQAQRHRVVTGADEKLLRVFDAPQTFVDTLTAISDVDLGSESVDRPLAASQPSLGLSNKPYFAGGAAPEPMPIPYVLWFGIVVFILLFLLRTTIIFNSPVFFPS